MRLTRLLGICLLALVLASPTWASDIVGLGAGVAPDYEGSDDAKGVPMFMYTHVFESGRFIKLMGTNLKANLLADKHYSLGPVLNYRLERDKVDNDQVQAMDKVDAATELGAFAGIDVNNLLLGAEFLADISNSHDGWTLQGTLGYRWKAMPELTITPTLFTTYADNDYMDTYFSVDASNRGSSTLPNYSADSGMKDFGINLVAHYTPWQNWGIMGLVSYKKLLNDAKDSPLVDDVGDDNQWLAGLMVTYRWGQ